jgi:hypothetical protein
MKQKLLPLLKPKMASKGFDQETLESIADLLANNLTEESTEEEINTAIDSFMPQASLMQSAINRSVNKVVTKPKPVESAKPTETPADPAPTTDPALLAILQELRGEIATIKGEKVVNTWKSKLEENLKESDPKFKAATLKAFGRMKFDNEDQFNEYLSEVSEDAKEFVAPSFQSDRPTGSAGKPAAVKEATKEEAATVLKTIM